MPVFVIEMGGHLGLMHLMPQNWSNWISFALSTPVVLWAGAPFFARGWRSLVTRNLNMFTLIAMGTGVGLGSTAWSATLAPQLFPPAFRDMHGEVAVYFEAAAVITVLVLLGQVLELRARDATSGAIRALLGLAPKTARRIAEARRRRRGAGAIAVGDRLRVRPGEKIPVDGVVDARPLVGRRIDGDGRIDAGEQGRRRACDRRHRQSKRRAGRARGKGRPRHHAGAHRRHGGAGAALAARRSSASPTRSPAGSCRR